VSAGRRRDGLRARLAQALGLALAFACAGSARAQTEPVPVPTGECRGGYWSGSRNLDDATDLARIGCVASWRWRATPGVGFVASARAGRNWTLGTPGQQADATDARLREASVELERDAWTLRLGRQIVVWGRSDRIGPLDLLSPRDFTLLTGDDDEQRNGLDAATLRGQLSETVSVTAVIARFGADRRPTGLLPPGYAVSGPSDAAEYALRVDRTGTGWDAALTGFDGYRRSPRSWAQAGPTGVAVAGAYERVRTVGADAATSLGAWTARAELAWSRTEPDCAGCPLEPRRLFEAVIGVDRAIGATAMANVQLYRLQRTGYQSPSTLSGAAGAVAAGVDRLNGEFGAIEHGVTFRVADRLMNDRLRLELAAFVDTSGRSQLYRPRATWSFSDRYKLNAGADLFNGPAQSLFGSRVRNQLAFVELAVVF
jgi:hypothetical protein